MIVIERLSQYIFTYIFGVFFNNNVTYHTLILQDIKVCARNSNQCFKNKKLLFSDATTQVWDI